MTLHQNIAHYRKRAKLTQKEVAGRCGMREDQYGRYERGYHIPNVMIALTIAQVLGTTVEALYE